MGAGGVIYALAVELHKEDPLTAAARVAAIADTVGLLLDTAAQTRSDPATAALELAQHRLGAAARRLGARLAGCGQPGVA